MLLPTVPKYTRPKRIICRDTLFKGFAQPDGSWGSYKTAKRFDDDETARVFAFLHELTDFQVMPISKPRAMK